MKEERICTAKIGQMADDEIVGLFFAREEAAIQAVRDKYGSFIRHITRNVCGSPEDGEECESDVYLSAWNRIPPERPLSLKAFLGKIARDSAVSRYRSEHAEKRFAGTKLLIDELEECLPAGSTPEREAEAGELAAAINRWLKTLSAEERALFLRRYYFGDPVKTIAAENGLKENTAAQKLLRLRGSLKNFLEAEEWL